MTTEQQPHKFRYLLPPGSNFQFMGRAKLCFIISALLIVGTVAMLFINKSARGSYLNWTIDFKGGTEIVYAFDAKTDPTKRVAVDAAAVRAALKASGEDGFDVSETSWEVDDAQGNAVEIAGVIVRTPRFSAMTQEQADKSAADFRTALADKHIEKAVWSGERLYVRSTTSLVGVDASAPFKANGFELKPWTDDEQVAYGHPDEGTGEYHAVFAIRGIDGQIETVLEAAIADVDAKVVQSYGVGARAGAELRNDAIKSLVYAMFLIMLYLAFRFDLRYAPGAAFATLHDAIMVVLVFAATWTEVSLTTVAAVLTVIGFSVNDTIVIFDRIRENQAKLKDKKLERIVDISLNETLVRSILTSLTVFAITLIMNIFGDGMVKNFAFAMNVGVVVGSYSSLFLAAPIFVWISRRYYSGSARQRVYKTHAVQAEE
jgi:preprotein translocase subunit SecF